MNQKDFHKTLYNTLLDSIRTNPDNFSLGLKPSEDYQMQANRSLSTKLISLNEASDKIHYLFRDDLDGIADLNSAKVKNNLVHFKPEGYRMEGIPGTNSVINISRSLEYDSESGGTHVINITSDQFIINFYKGLINLYLPSEDVASFSEPNLQEETFNQTDFFNYLSTMIVNYLTY